jgi:hypothetical protein
MSRALDVSTHADSAARLVIVDRRTRWKLLEKHYPLVVRAGRSEATDAVDEPPCFGMTGQVYRRWKRREGHDLKRA